MNYKVSFSSGINASVKIGQNKFKVSESKPVTKFQDLEDFNQTGVKNNYLISYDAVTKTYKTVDPDEILVAAVDGSGSSVGIPTAFITQIASDLEDKVSLDGGVGF